MRKGLDIYWDPAFADDLDRWGEDHAWIEIQLLMAGCTGRVLDIACGTGVVMSILNKFDHIDVHGVDISDYLIARAVKIGIPWDQLRIGSAADALFVKDEFDYSYSIGSLEHFPLGDLTRAIRECGWYTRMAAFHMVPVSRSGTNEGWMTTAESGHQEFYNQSEEWWTQQFEERFKRILVVDSKWETKVSVGRWFLCYK